MSDLHLRIQNEDATKPLIVPVFLLVNTPADILVSHILENSKNTQKWVKFEKEHDGTVLICGSGPSLVESLPDILLQRKNGAKVFALNAAAKFLKDHGIKPDAQVIIDAKSESVSFVSDAKDHYFGATVDPECFKLKPNAYLFQLQVDDEELEEKIDNLAPYEFPLLSTAVSVGVVATILAYTLGYRKIECYGVDSSHKNDESHVVRQQMNDAIPCMDVEFCGKKYISSFPMKVQAERFMQVANLLSTSGCNVSVHGSGLLPDMFRANIDDMNEKEKYERMWSMLTYRQDSPAEQIVDLIIEKLDPKGKILDFGCGTGRAAKAISDKGYDVHLIDFASNCRDEAACNLPFTQLDLTEEIPLKAEYGYCVDVMEHIPPEQVESVVKNIMESANNVFFQISTINDRCGLTIGKELHLTVKPIKWWVDMFEKNGNTVVWSQDDVIECKLLVRRENATV